MECYRLGDSYKKEELLRDLGVDSGGVKIMALKMETILIKIKNLRTPAGNILKQDALSIGADLALPRGAVTCEKEYIDAILIATPSQLKRLIQKEKSQPFGLSKLATNLSQFLREPKEKIEIMGVINANSDSFYTQSRFMGDEAIKQIEKMVKDGANIIDIGAVSTRPGSIGVDTSEELNRIKPICNTIKRENLYKDITFSIDSTNPIVVQYALDSGFKLINDISGASDDKLVKLAIEYETKYCLMHMRGTPKTMQDNPQYEDITAEVGAFFSKRLAKCEELGLTRDRVILDVGIGFGKSLEHNLTLLKNHKNFLKFGCELLIGASRKSMIDKITPTPTSKRLPGTLALHLKAIENGATIVRCHDVAEHYQAIKVWEALRA